MRPYVKWKESILWSRIDFDWSFGYQCVDLIKDYFDKVLKMKVWKTGNAKEIWVNKYKIFGSDWMRSKDLTNLMQGDVIVRYDKNYWHISIFDRFIAWKIYVLEQNWSGSNSGSGIWQNAIRIKWYDPSFFTGVWRSLKIIDNFCEEEMFIKLKLQDNPDDKITLDYLKSIRIK